MLDRSRAKSKNYSFVPGAKRGRWLSVVREIELGG
jgi:hypothetical protein